MLKPEIGVGRDSPKVNSGGDAAIGLRIQIDELGRNRFTGRSVDLSSTASSFSRQDIGGTSPSAILALVYRTLAISSLVRGRLVQVAARLDRGPCPTICR